MNLIGKLFKFAGITVGTLVGAFVLLVIGVVIFGDTNGTDDPDTPSPTATERIASKSTVQPTEPAPEVAQADPSEVPTEQTSPAVARAFTCLDFDNWVWAQAIFDQDPGAHAALDPDGNGMACEQLTVYGFAPAFWSDKVPEKVTKATLVSVSDGDTIKVHLEDGTTETVRLLHIDTPETGGTVGQCGGTEATSHLNWILSYAGGGTVYLEGDVTERDRFDRRLAYVWFNVDGDANPYMANHAMVIAGWAESESFGPDIKYKSELDAAEKFSVDHVTGTRLLCGKFGQPANDAHPSDEQVRQAWLKQPNQGQLPPFPGTVGDTSIPSVNPVTANTANNNNAVVVVPPASGEGQQPSDQPAAEQPVEQDPVIEQPVVEQPVVQEPVVEQPVAQEPVNECDPSYPDFCLAPAWVIGDLDCGDVSYGNFRVVPPDSHGFDRDGDGYGCESN